MRATGVPRSILLARQLALNTEELRKTNERLDHIEDKVETVFPNLVGDHVCTEIRKHFQVEGVVPLSLNDLNSMQERMMTEFEKRLDTHAKSLSSTTGASNQTHDSSANGPFQFFHWTNQEGAVFHRVPQGWEFPKGLNPKIGWNLWNYGDMNTGICPFKYLSRKHDLPTEAMKTAYTRLSKVMEHLDRVIDREKFIPEQFKSITELPVVEAEKIFLKGMDILITEAYQRCGRVCRSRAKVTIGTLHGLLAKEIDNSHEGN